MTGVAAIVSVGAYLGKSKRINSSTCFYLIHHHIYES